MTSTSQIRLSVLDLSPVSAGMSGSQALQNTLDLARLADQLGYTRYWLAEHHNSAFIASAVPEVMIGHVAAVTTRMKIGSGGVMLPNHAPLKVAETFRTLEALHPGRIDLGIGRAPGTDSRTALALRRSREALFSDDFPEQMTELMGFLTDNLPADHPFRSIVAMPRGVGMPDIWLLGSSDYSARMAASMGLGFAFAHHIQPEPALESLRLYQDLFRPSPYFSEPHAMVAVSVICAETDEHAEELVKPLELAMLHLRQGNLQPLVSVAQAMAYPYTDADRQMIQALRGRIFIGSPATVHRRLSGFAEKAGVTEIMVTTIAYDHQDRCRSYELLADAFGIGG